MRNSGRTRPARWVQGGLVLACGGLLVACGGQPQADRPAPGPSATSGTPATASPSPSPSSSDASLEGRGPVLSVEQGPYPHTVRIVDAFVSPDAPESPAPKDLTYVQLVLKVAGTPGRPLKAPHPNAYWVVRYDGCKTAQEADSQVGCGGMDDGTAYFTEEDMHSPEFGPGVPRQFGDLAADTPYWTRAWQLVPEGADLSRARLCEGGRAEDPDNCVPLGTVRRDGGQGPTAG